MKRGLFLLLFLLIGCASDKPKGKTEAEVLYKEAQRLADDGRFILANERLNQLKSQFPYSVYATPAELMQADILYKQENFIEAAAAYMLFRDFHPKHEKIAYVVFRIGESYFKQIPDTVDRDLQPAAEAIKYYDEVISRFSSSEYVKISKDRISQAERMLRDKELYVADFYYKTENYEAARWRYLNMISNFEDEQLLRHSRLRVIQSSVELKDYAACLHYAQQFETQLDFKELKLEKTIKDCYKKYRETKQS